MKKKKNTKGKYVRSKRTLIISIDMESWNSLKNRNSSLFPSVGLGRDGWNIWSIHSTIQAPIQINEKVQSLSKMTRNFYSKTNHTFNLHLERLFRAEFSLLVLLLACVGVNLVQFAISTCVAQIIKILLHLLHWVNEFEKCVSNIIAVVRNYIQ